MHMGKMKYQTGWWGSIAVHPHAYGEHLLSVLSVLSMGGSSPCIWGTSYRVNPFALYSRFIPMHMGNIGTFPLLMIEIAVHPHAYGEHISTTCSKYE
ncbi:hypothetical protein CHISP_1485 [Chitinispirillum alkaliphilum]|nr:hypothetical protein CHISP_1485 [Chitinispirillum alkaliphilum]